MTQLSLLQKPDRPCMRCGTICPYPLAFCRQCLGLSESEYERHVEIGLDIMEHGIQVSENPDELELMLLEAFKRQMGIWAKRGLSREERGRQLLDSANDTGATVFRMIKGGREP